MINHLVTIFLVLANKYHLVSLFACSPLCRTVGLDSCSLLECSFSFPFKLLRRSCARQIIQQATDPNVFAFRTLRNFPYGTSVPSLNQFSRARTQASQASCGGAPSSLAVVQTRRYWLISLARHIKLVCTVRAESPFWALNSYYPFVKEEEKR